MKEHLKSVPIFEQSDMTVSDGVIKNVVVVNGGDDKDGGHFSDTFLEEVVKEGNKSEKGVKSRFGHPSPFKSGIGTYIGRFKNFQLTSKRVVADLHLADITKDVHVEGKGITVFDYVTKIAKEDDEAIGASMHFYSMIKKSNGRDHYNNLHGIRAIDMVDEPATTDGLFKEKEPEINNITKYIMKGIKKEIQKIFETKKDITLTTAGGDMVTFVTDAEEIQVGDPVNDEDGNPVGADSVVLQDGRTLGVEDGKVSSIEEAQEDAVDVAAEIEKSLKPYKKSIDALTETLEKQNEELEETKKAMSTQKEEYEQRLKSLEGKDYTPKKEEKEEKDLTLSERIEKKYNKKQA